VTSESAVTGFSRIAGARLNKNIKTSQISIGKTIANKNNPAIAINIRNMTKKNMKAFVVSGNPPEPEESPDELVPLEEPLEVPCDPPELDPFPLLPEEPPEFPDDPPDELPEPIPKPKLS